MLVLQAWAGDEHEYEYEPRWPEPLAMDPSGRRFAEILEARVRGPPLVLVLVLEAWVGDEHEHEYEYEYEPRRPEPLAIDRSRGRFAEILGARG